MAINKFIHLIEESLTLKFSYAGTVLRGMAQIMLQENVFTGLFFIAGIFYDSLLMGLAAMVAVCCGTITARIFRFNKSETQKGRYGFSSALVGVALVLFLKPGWMPWLFIIIGASVAAIVQHWFNRKKIPVFTLPFVLVTWAIISFFRVALPADLASPESSLQIMQPNFLLAFRGYGQVIFQGSAVAGFIFFIGVFIHSPVAALFGLMGSALAGVVAIWLSAPLDAVSMGLFSYNAVLCAIVFSGRKIQNVIWSIISVLLSVIISLIMFNKSVIQLTFPFVAATCICLVLKKYFDPVFARLNLK